MSIGSSTTQLVSTLKPSIGITDDEPHNLMDVAVPNNLTKMHNNPKNVFKTQKWIRNKLWEGLLELLGNSDSLKRFDTVRYQLKIKKKSHLAPPVSEKALHDTLLAFINAGVAYWSVNICVCSDNMKFGMSGNENWHVW